MAIKSKVSNIECIQRLYEFVVNYVDKEHYDRKLNEDIKKIFKAANNGYWKKSDCEGKLMLVIPTDSYEFFGSRKKEEDRKTYYSYNNLYLMVDYDMVLIEPYTHISDAKFTFGFRDDESNFTCWEDISITFNDLLQLNIPKKLLSEFINTYQKDIDKKSKEYYSDEKINQRYDNLKDWNTEDYIGKDIDPNIIEESLEEDIFTKEYHKVLDELEARGEIYCDITPEVQHFLTEKYGSTIVDFLINTLKDTNIVSFVTNLFIVKKIAGYNEVKRKIESDFPYLEIISGNSKYELYYNWQDYGKSLFSIKKIDSLNTNYFNSISVNDLLNVFNISKEDLSWLITESLSKLEWANPDLDDNNEVLEESNENNVYENRLPDSDKIFENIVEKYIFTYNNVEIEEETFDKIKEYLRTIFDEKIINYENQKYEHSQKFYLLELKHMIHNLCISQIFANHNKEEIIFDYKCIKCTTNNEYYSIITPDMYSDMNFKVNINHKGATYWLYGLEAGELINIFNVNHQNVSWLCSIRQYLITSETDELYEAVSSFNNQRYEEIVNPEDITEEKIRELENTDEDEESENTFDDVNNYWWELENNIPERKKIIEEIRNGETEITFKYGTIYVKFKDNEEMQIVPCDTDSDYGKWYISFRYMPNIFQDKYSTNDLIYIFGINPQILTKALSEIKTILRTTDNSIIEESVENNEDKVILDFIKDKLGWLVTTEDDDEATSENIKYISDVISVYCKSYKNGNYETGYFSKSWGSVVTDRTNKEDVRYMILIEGGYPDGWNKIVSSGRIYYEPEKYTFIISLNGYDKLGDERHPISAGDINRVFNLSNSLISEIIKKNEGLFNQYRNTNDKEEVLEESVEMKDNGIIEKLFTKVNKIDYGKYNFLYEYFVSNTKWKLDELQRDGFLVDTEEGLKNLYCPVLINTIEAKGESLFDNPKYSVVIKPDMFGKAFDTDQDFSFNNFHTLEDCVYDICLVKEEDINKTICSVEVSYNDILQDKVINSSIIKAFLLKTNEYLIQVYKLHNKSKEEVIEESVKNNSNKELEYCIANVLGSKYNEWDNNVKDLLVAELINKIKFYRDNYSKGEYRKDYFSKPFGSVVTKDTEKSDVRYMILIEGKKELSIYNCIIYYELKEDTFKVSFVGEADYGDKRHPINAGDIQRIFNISNNEIRDIIHINEGLQNQYNNSQEDVLEESVEENDNIDQVIMDWSKESGQQISEIGMEVIKEIRKSDDISVGLFDADTGKPADEKIVNMNNDYPLIVVNINYKNKKRKVLFEYSYWYMCFSFTLYPEVKGFLGMGNISIEEISKIFNIPMEFIRNCISMTQHHRRIEQLRNKDEVIEEAEELPSLEEIGNEINSWDETKKENALLDKVGELLPTAQYRLGNFNIIEKCDAIIEMVYHPQKWQLKEKTSGIHYLQYDSEENIRFKITYDDNTYDTIINNTYIPYVLEMENVIGSLENHHYENTNIFTLTLSELMSLLHLPREICQKLQQENNNYVREIQNYHDEKEQNNIIEESLDVSVRPTLENSWDLAKNIVSQCPNKEDIEDVRKLKCTPSSIEYLKQYFLKYFPESIVDIIIKRMTENLFPIPIDSYIDTAILLTSIIGAKGKIVKNFNDRFQPIIYLSNEIADGVPVYAEIYYGKKPDLYTNDFAELKEAVYNMNVHSDDYELDVWQIELSVSSLINVFKVSKELISELLIETEKEVIQDNEIEESVKK